MNQPIDLVYLWCDGNEPSVLAKRLRLAKRLGIAMEGKNTGACRYRDNGELRFALRSVESFAPWIGTVHIVMDDDQSPPSWLDVSCKKLHIVRHSQIMPADVLPCFSARTIEFGIPHIPGLSEHFLYSNDDMFFAQAVEPSFFFAKDGFPFCRYIRSKVKIDGEYDSAYVSAICNNAKFVRDHVVTGMTGSRLPKSFCHMPHHNVDAYNKTTLLEFEKRFPDEIKRNFGFPFRDRSQLQREVWGGYAQVMNQGHYRLVERPWFEWIFTGHKRDSFQAHVGRDYLMRKFEAVNPFLFCFNDNPNATQEDWREVNSFMEKLFPKPSAFEL